MSLGPESGGLILLQRWLRGISTPCHGDNITRSHGRILCNFEQSIISSILLRPHLAVFKTWDHAESVAPVLRAIPYRGTISTRWCGSSAPFLFNNLAP